ncbi:hypothetical protein MPNT_40022 [Candidatus Methylacidithermus pantelleriae]|uniref:Sec-independent protein translocase protein TatA n=2 Tax=Candidatus Methylacidithermus pantelleriae TaxID=2744239 RepID=A0A8J2BUU3_9BACT|nr:hypothetical protein MPNT_40022 [Candidatus Methylacidithermus pantelleriae]
MHLFALGLPSGQEWFWIFVVVFLLFGAKRLPELARGLGRALGEFHRAREEFEREIHRTVTPPPPGAVPQNESLGDSPKDSSHGPQQG